MFTGYSANDWDFDPIGGFAIPMFRSKMINHKVDLSELNNYLIAKNFSAILNSQEHFLAAYCNAYCQAISMTSMSKKHFSVIIENEKALISGVNYQVKDIMKAIEKIRNHLLKEAKLEDHVAEFCVINGRVLLYILKNEESLDISEQAAQSVLVENYKELIQPVLTYLAGYLGADYCENTAKKLVKTISVFSPVKLDVTIVRFIWNNGFRFH